jgi:integrase
LKISDIDAENSNITTISKKNRKSMGTRSIPHLIMQELSKYVTGLNIEEGKIFTDNLSQKKWVKIRETTGLGDLKFHDLSKTFGSILAQNGISTAVTQRSLEHLFPTLTNKVYTNDDPVLRDADILPVGV